MFARYLQMLMLLELFGLALRRTPSLRQGQLLGCALDRLRQKPHQ
jgi:hypothetical protein